MTGSVKREPLRYDDKMNRHSMSFTAADADVDYLNHVNNAVWLHWVQDITISHWNAVASSQLQAAYAWVVLRHEIDYRGNLSKGESVAGYTWVEDAKGARLRRRTQFIGADGKMNVEVLSTWVCIATTDHRPTRVPSELLAPPTRSTSEV